MCVLTSTDDSVRRCAVSLHGELRGAAVDRRVRVPGEAAESAAAAKVGDDHRGPSERRICLPRSLSPRVRVNSSSQAPTSTFQTSQQDLLTPPNLQAISMAISVGSIRDVWAAGEAGQLPEMPQFNPHRMHVTIRDDRTR